MVFIAGVATRLGETENCGVAAVKRGGGSEKDAPVPENGMNCMIR